MRCDASLTSGRTHRPSARPVAVTRCGVPALVSQECTDQLMEHFGHTQGHHDPEEYERQQNEMEEEVDKLFAQFDINRDKKLTIDEVSKAIDVHHGKDEL